MERLMTLWIIAAGVGAVGGTVWFLIEGLVR